MAFVDLRKAYDSVPRDTLWRILRVYGVHTKLIDLLMDLHTGTQAAVRMGGVVSEWFDVHGGVRQGCVIAPLLFNIYMDFVVRQATAQMPEGCGVKLAYHADGKLERDGCGSGGCVELLSVLLYADDMVLLSPSREELVVMLQVMDKVAASLELRINASKTEILSIDKDWKEGDVPVQQVPEVVISEGVVKEVSLFKYLGSVLVTDGRLDVELNIRRGKAVGRFKQFEKMWGTKTHTCLKYIDPSPNFSDFPTSALVSVCFLHISVTLSGPPVKCWDIPKTDFDRLVSVRVRGLFVNSQD